MQEKYLPTYALPNNPYYRGPGNNYGRGADYGYGRGNWGGGWSYDHDRTLTCEAKDRVGYRYLVRANRRNSRAALNQALNGCYTQSRRPNSCFIVGCY
jgi:hypothetical protein